MINLLIPKQTRVSEIDQKRHLWIELKMRVPVKLLGFIFWLFFFYCGQCKAKQKSCRDLTVKNGFTYKHPSNEEEIFYSCDTGYKPFTGNWWDSVTCSKGSWSEEPRCIPVEECGAFPSVHHGKLKQMKKTFRDGETTVFECDPGFIPTQDFIECVNGTWRTPVCKEAVRCGFPPKVENAFIRSKPEEFYVDGSSVTYVCQSSFAINGKRIVSCRNGIWEETPTCREVMCVTNLPANMRSDRHPGPEVSVRPEHTLSLSCVEGLKIQGQSTITCGPNGKWKVPFPKCVREATCPLNTRVEDLTIERFPDNGGPVKPGHKLKFSCNRRGLKVKGQSEIICQSNGEWSGPFPKCEEIMCVANLTANMRSDRSDPGPEVSVRPGETITLSCVGEGSELQRQSTITCRPNGEWNVRFPNCGEGKCGQPPQVAFGDTLEMLKDGYDSGERVEYICFNKYKLDQRPPYSKYLTCDQGEWRGNIKCLKPCTVTVEGMDKIGIQLRYGENQKMFAPHDDYITFECQWGKRLKVNINPRQKCNDGEMTLPECE